MLSDETQITELIAHWRSLGHTVGLCHGVFDLLHMGHTEHFREAKELVDKLVVSVTSDKHVNKGSGKPIFSHENRRKMLESIKYIDLVIGSDFSTGQQSIELIKPNLYFKGPDYQYEVDDIKLQSEMLVVRSYGGEIYFTSGPKLSSSHYASSFVPIYTPIFVEWLKHNYTLKTIEELIRKISDFEDIQLNIYGDTILDKYIMCDALGKSGKAPLVVFKELSENLILGGVLAVARNASDFVSRVSLNTFFSHEAKTIIENDLMHYSKIQVINSKFANSRPEVYMKSRFLEKNTKQPIFITYRSVSDLLEENKADFGNRSKISNEVCENIQIDLLVDYGHGYLTSEASRDLMLSDNFVAVNLQLNASSGKPSDISSYRKCDAIFVNRKELVWHFGADENSFLELIPKVFALTSCSYLVVTLGDQGVLVANKNGDRVQVPSLSSRVFDRVGAGDALLSIGTLACGMGMNLRDIGLLGNLAANLNLAHLGNTYTLQKSDLIQELKLLINHI